MRRLRLDRPFHQPTGRCLLPYLVFFSSFVAAFSTGAVSSSALASSVLVSGSASTLASSLALALDLGFFSVLALVSVFFFSVSALVVSISVSDGSEMVIKPSSSLSILTVMRLGGCLIPRFHIRSFRSVSILISSLFMCLIANFLMSATARFALRCLGVIIAVSSGIVYILVIGSFFSSDIYYSYLTFVVPCFQERFLADLRTRLWVLIITQVGTDIVRLTFLNILFFNATVLFRAIVFLNPPNVELSLWFLNRHQETFDIV